jgi:hypothetical protein
MGKLIYGNTNGFLSLNRSYAPYHTGAFGALVTLSQSKNGVKKWCQKMVGDATSLIVLLPYCQKSVINHKVL